MSTTGAKLHDYARTQLARAIACLGWRGRRVHEGVHQARKSMRRVRACLALADFDRSDEGHRLDRRIARLCRELSALRDAHARIETLDRLIEDSEAATQARLLRRVRRSAVAERSDALARAQRADADFSARRRALQELAATLDALPWADLDDHRLAQGLKRSLKRCRKAEARALSDGDADDWHRWRRRRRRLLQQHSALEACASDVAQILDPQRELAHYLGESQDLSVLLLHFGHSRRLPSPDREALGDLLGNALETKQRAIARWLDDHHATRPTADESLRGG
jgi:hypothetical protein